MLKGCKKQMIVLHGTGSEIFDEAYFILKKGDDGRHSAIPEGNTMYLEANRIVEENRLGSVYRPASYYSLRYVLSFLSGLLTGIALVILAISIY